MRSLRYLIVLTAALGMLAIANVQAQQRMVLWEEFTQWNCPPCGQANPGIEKMLSAKYRNAIHIWYHGTFPDVDDDPMNHFDVSDQNGRYSYYSINSEPQCAIDGKQSTPSGGYLGDPQDTTYDKTVLTSAEGVSTPVSIAITETPDGNGGASVHIVVSSTQALTGQDMLRVAVVKDIIDTTHMPGNPARNPEVEFLNVVQKMLPDYNGSSISIANAGGQQSFDFTYTSSNVMSTSNPSRTFIVAWVQDDQSKQILNAATDFYPVIMPPAPATLTIAAPAATSTLNQTVRNSYTSSATVISSFSASVPNAWQAGYTINGTAAPSGAPDTTTIDAGQSANYIGNIVMTGGKGLGNATLSLNETVGDTAFISSYQFFSISNDVNTLFIDGTDNANRTSAYMASLNAASNKYNSVAVAATKDISPTLLAQDHSLHAAFFSDADDQSPDPNNIAAMANFAQQGGDIVVASNILGTIGAIYTSQYGITFYSDFLSQILHANWVGEAGNMYTVSTYSNDTVGKGVSSPITTTAQNPNLGIHFYPDIIKIADASARPMLEYTGSGFSADSLCGVRYQGAYKSVYLSVPMEALATNARNTLMQNILTWFNGTSGPNAVNEQATPATDFQLVQNYPNPFAGTTDIRFTLPQDENVTLNVYDMKGSLVATVANSLFHAGANSVTFDGSNLSTGVYEYRLTTPSGTLTHLMSLVRQ
jgi:hypothetical protein